MWCVIGTTSCVWPGLQDVGVSAHVDKVLAAVVALGGDAGTPIEDIIAELEPSALDAVGLLAIPRGKVTRALAAAKEKLAHGAALLSPAVLHWQSSTAAARGSRTSSGGTGVIGSVHATDLARVRSLGAGAFGEVYLALWRGDTRVAVKANGVRCADGSAIHRERRLLETLARHPHNNIVTVYGMCEDAIDGELRIVMQYCELGNLEDYLRRETTVGRRCGVTSGLHLLNRRGGCVCVSVYVRVCLRQADQKLTVLTALRVLQQCCAALRHLHHHGIMHRDFRAANCLVASALPLVIKVSDFGVSHQLSRFYRSNGDGGGADSNAASAGPGVAGSVVVGAEGLGPHQWMAPEVLTGSFDGGRDVTPASDVYMLGGLMFEVLTGGRHPFHWIPAEVLLRRRLTPADTLLRLPGRAPASGLRDLSVVEAARADGVPMEWKVAPASGLDDDAVSAASAARFLDVVALMEHCLDAEPSRRPSVSSLQRRLMALIAAEEAGMPHEVPDVSYVGAEHQ